MSAGSNPTTPHNPKRVLMVIPNPSHSPTTGWPVGFWWSELTHPFWEFSEAGYEIEVSSPEGGRVEADGFSDPDHESGYAKHDFLSRGFKASPDHRALLNDTSRLAEADPSDFDAVFFVGGQSPMVTYRGDGALQATVARFLEAGRVTALVCHATCLLLEARAADGSLLVKDRTWTGFANAEERYADDFVGRKIQSFWIEEEARRLADTNFVVDQPFRAFAVRDGLLVTGQQQFSGRAAARLVIEAVGR